MKVGDLVIVAMEFPDWHWLEYETGEVGIVMKVSDHNYGFDILDIFFFGSEETVPMPSYFVEKITEKK